MSYPNYCVVCGHDYCIDFECLFCENRVCSNSDHNFEGKFFCDKCWELGAEERMNIEKISNEYDEILKSVWNKWQKKCGKDL
jgi:hypothetical protein